MLGIIFCIHRTGPLYRTIGEVCPQFFTLPKADFQARFFGGGAMKDSTDQELNQVTELNGDTAKMNKDGVFSTADMAKVIEEIQNEEK